MDLGWSINCPSTACRPRCPGYAASVRLQVGWCDGLAPPPPKQVPLNGLWDCPASTSMPFARVSALPPLLLPDLTSLAAPVRAAQCATGAGGEGRGTEVRPQCPAASGAQRTGGEVTSLSLKEVLRSPESAHNRRSLITRGQGQGRAGRAWEMSGGTQT